MRQLRITPATVMVVLALVVTAGGSAVAATLITGAQIKDRSITRVDIAKDTLTGQEIRESKLGAVPNAKHLGGVGPSGYLRSTRIESGTVSILGYTGSRTLFTDKRLGLRVLYTTQAKLTLLNLNTSATLHYTGVGHAFGGTVHGVVGDIGPSSSVTIYFDAVGISYGSFLITRTASKPVNTRVLQLSCSLEDSVKHVFSCQGVG